jgi:hypothetical protein
MSDIVTLVFTPDDPRNTTITDGETGKILYTVATEYANKRAVTRIWNAGGVILASSEWRDVRSDVITLGATGTPFPSSAWLKKSWVPFKE